MEIWVATITHRHGTNVYAAKTEAGIDKQLAEYARENWETEDVPGSYEGKSDSAVVSDYFDYMTGQADEFLQKDRLKVED